MNLLRANGATETELPSPQQLTDAEYAWLNDKKASGIALHEEAVLDLLLEDLG